MDEPINSLSGVGDKVAKTLARLGVQTVGDLVTLFPRRYEDYSQITRLREVQPGPLSAQVRITSVSGRYVRRGLHITEAILSDDGGSVKAVWFNQPYRSKQLQKNKEYFVSGKYEFGKGSYSLVNPSLELVSDFPKNSARVVPIYPETKGLKSHTIRKLVAQLKDRDLGFETNMPYPTELSIGEAIKLLHFPQSMADVERAQAFFAFEETFSLVLAAVLVKQQNKALQAEPVPINEPVLKEFAQSLPFQLTDDQRAVSWKAIKDMSGTAPMNRLVEGDVGSGKTVVAAMLALHTVRVGSQVAIMAPTEVLARQHAKSLDKLLGQFGVRVGLSIGALKSAQRIQLKKALVAGELDVLVGTHALIQDGIEFASLNLVVIDEQHRFGVEQRAKLVGKSKKLPHVLTMTATPIPRTLALTLFGDLDISLIKHMPKGRKKIETKLISPNSKKPMHDLVLRELQGGRQAFVIYPLIEESETLESTSAKKGFDELRKGAYKEYRVGLLHGRMKSEEKEEIMRQFVAHEIDVLVSTTVIEVGVDVPNASVMVIEGAERFGLAQIHQLRGRVGRGEHQSYCFFGPVDVTVSEQ